MIRQNARAVAYQLVATEPLRPLAGDASGIDLVLGYRQSNRSPLLQLFVPRLLDMLAQNGKS